MAPSTQDANKHTKARIRRRSVFAREKGTRFLSHKLTNLAKLRR